MKNRLRVLSILCENLKNPQPELVRIEKIAGALQLGLSQTRQLLRKMDQDGEIQSDLDGNYSLITPTGLHCLEVSTHPR